MPYGTRAGSPRRSVQDLRRAALLHARRRSGCAKVWQDDDRERRDGADAAGCRRGAGWAILARGTADHVHCKRGGWVAKDHCASWLYGLRYLACSTALLGAYYRF